MDSFLLKTLLNTNDETYWHILILKTYLLIVLNEVSFFNEINGKTSKLHRHSLISAWIAVVFPIYHYYDRSMIDDYQPLLAWLFGLYTIFSGSEFTMCFGYFLACVYTFPVMDVYLDSMICVCLMFEFYDVGRTLSISPYALFVPLWFISLGGMKHVFYLNFMVALYDYLEMMTYPKYTYYIAIFYIWASYQFEEIKELFFRIADSNASDKSVN